MAEAILTTSPTELSRAHLYALQLVDHARDDDQAYACLDIASDIWSRIVAMPIISRTSAAMKLDAVLDFWKSSGGAQKANGSDLQMLEEVSRFLRAH